MYHLGSVKTLAIIMQKSIDMITHKTILLSLITLLIGVAIGGWGVRMSYEEKIATYNEYIKTHPHKDRGLTDTIPSDEIGYKVIDTPSRVVIYYLKNYK